MPSGRESGGGKPRTGRRGGRGGGRRPLADSASAEAARGTAIGLLSRRDYARSALKDRLTDAGFESATAESAVVGLEQERLVNDERYVEAAVAGRIARGQGPLRIALELRRAGVSPALVAAAIDSQAPEWRDRAILVQRRRFGPGAPRDPRQRARQARFLLYRGFTSDHVRAALGARADETFADLELAAEDPPAGDTCTEEPG
jgi:regulatory protein